MGTPATTCRVDPALSLLPVLLALLGIPFQLPPSNQPPTPTTSGTTGMVRLGANTNLVLSFTGRNGESYRSILTMVVSNPSWFTLSSPSTVERAQQQEGRRHLAAPERLRHHAMRRARHPRHFLGAGKADQRAEERVEARRRRVQEGLAVRQVPHLRDAQPGGAQVLHQAREGPTRR